METDFSKDFIAATFHYWDPFSDAIQLPLWLLCGCCCSQKVTFSTVHSEVLDADSWIISQFLRASSLPTGLTTNGGCKLAALGKCLSCMKETCYFGLDKNSNTRGEKKMCREDEWMGRGRLCCSSRTLFLTIQDVISVLGDLFCLAGVLFLNKAVH